MPLLDLYVAVGVKNKIFHGYSFYFLKVYLFYDKCKILGICLFSFKNLYTYSFDTKAKIVF